MKHLIKNVIPSYVINVKQIPLIVLYVLTQLPEILITVAYVEIPIMTTEIQPVIV